MTTYCDANEQLMNKAGRVAAGIIILISVIQENETLDEPEQWENTEWIPRHSLTCSITVNPRFPM